MFDMQVIVRLLKLSTQCLDHAVSRIMRPAMAQVIEDHPHNGGQMLDESAPITDTDPGSSPPKDHHIEPHRRLTVAVIAVGYDGSLIS